MFGNVSKSAVPKPVVVTNDVVVNIIGSQYTKTNIKKKYCTVPADVLPGVSDDLLLTLVG